MNIMEQLLLTKNIHNNRPVYSRISIQTGVRIMQIPHLNTLKKESSVRIGFNNCSQLKSAIAYMNKEGLKVTHLNSDYLGRLPKFEFRNRINHIILMSKQYFPRSVKQELSSKALSNIYHAFFTPAYINNSPLSFSEDILCNILSTYDILPNYWDSSIRNHFSKWSIIVPVNKHTQKSIALPNLELPQGVELQPIWRSEILWESAYKEMEKIAERVAINLRLRSGDIISLTDSYHNVLERIFTRLVEIDIKKQNDHIIVDDVVKLFGGFYKSVKHEIFRQMRDKSTASRIISNAQEIIQNDQNLSDPLNILLRTECLKLFNCALQKLSIQESKMLQDRFDNLSYSEIAKKYLLPLSTVKIKIHRIRKALKTNLHFYYKENEKMRDVYPKRR